MFWHSFKSTRFYFALALLAQWHAMAAGTNGLSEVWQVRLDNGTSASSPAIAPDGTIYQGTFGGRMLAISPEGKVQWTFRTNREIKSSPAVGTDGTIYFGCRDWKFYALTPAGKLKWTFATGAWVDSSPAIADDGTLYFGSWDKSFYALAPDGKLKWKFATSNLITTSPAIAADGTVYFGSHDKYFYALAPDGKLKWKFLTGAEIDASPTIAADGTVYFASTDGNLYALHPDGTESWRMHTGSYLASLPVLDGDGNLYFTAYKKNLSVTRDGKLRWEHQAEIQMELAELVTAGDWIYCTVPWLHVGFSDRAGNFDAGFQLGFNLASAPNLSPAGLIHACDGACLFALKPASSTPLEKSPWPMWRANPQHTGRVQK
ncbi:MAG: PQQ-binding-like beta-propeller repeat protein [Verrucomicrobiae bacterium]|nr:PQQ-binding-like beta-propeller repeat protein [Verrucomicrobiae bacterium]